MIKFFRRIRQQLLTESKFSKYLIYAIGEIILVVIGILIALQVNAWYETSKKMKLKQVYTQNLITDLKNDTIQLNARLKLNKNILLTRLDSIIHIIEHPATTSNDIKELGKKVGLGGLRVVNNYNTNTFNVLTASGNIDLYDDFVIQNIMELNSLQNFEIQISTNNRENYFDLYNRYREHYLEQNDSNYGIIVNELWDNVNAVKYAHLYMNAIKVKQHAMARYAALTKEVVVKTEALIQILDAQ